MVREIQCDADYENQQWVRGENCARDFRVIMFDPDGNYERTLTMNEQGDTLAMTTVKRENGEIVEEIYYVREYLTPKHSVLSPVSRILMDRASEEQVNFEIWQHDQMSFEGANYYDSKGRLERQAQLVNNRQVMVHNVYEKDLIVEMYREERDGSRSGTQLYEYAEFDKQGNWTLRLVFSGEDKITPDLALSREITYH